jgi:hypothetical protein
MADPVVAQAATDAKAAVAAAKTAVGTAESALAKIEAAVKADVAKAESLVSKVVKWITDHNLVIHLIGVGCIVLGVWRLAKKEMGVAEASTIIGAGTVLVGIGQWKSI